MVPVSASGSPCVVAPRRRCWSRRPRPARCRPRSSRCRGCRCCRRDHPEQPAGEAVELVVLVELVVGVLGAALIVRFTFAVELGDVLQVNVTSYAAAGLASQSTVALAVPPLGMVTVSNTPEDAVAVVEHPLAARVTWPPGAIAEGVTVYPLPLLDGPPAVAAYAVTAGAVMANAAAPSRATGATRIARMVIPPGPRGAVAERIPAKHQKCTSMPPTLEVVHFARDRSRPMVRRCPPSGARSAPNPLTPWGTDRGTVRRWPRGPGRRVSRSPRSGRAGRRSGH